MKKLLILAITSSLLFASCISKKEHASLEAKYKNSQDLLNTATVKLNSCLTDKATAEASLSAMSDRLADMKQTNENLIQSSKDLTMLTSKGAENLEKSLESMKEKGYKISQVHQRNDVHSCFKEFRVDLPNLDYLEKHLVCIPCGWWLDKEDLL